MRASLEMFGIILRLCSLRTQNSVPNTQVRVTGLRVEKKSRDIVCNLNNLMQFTKYFTEIPTLNRWGYQLRAILGESYSLPIGI